MPIEIKFKIPKKILTVIIRDMTEFNYMHEPVSYRSVDIILTENQLKQLELKSYDNGLLFEDISNCFLQDVKINF